MRNTLALNAAGDSHPGLVRSVNEDRFHVDAARGILIVVDGVGGHAAGGKAADTALRMLRSRLERETGPPSERVREAITIANNEIHRLASTRAEWHGMACVLTVAVVEEGRATIGHVGDSRLYKFRDRLEKVTHDHSPVGEREDSNEISEAEAMRHPRRNEVYRDVGSEEHQPADADFIDLVEIPFEHDAALLLCSDGLTDVVRSTVINHVVQQFAGRPDQVVGALIEAANDAGGKDNITVVFAEGDEFAAAHARSSASARAHASFADHDDTGDRARNGLPKGTRRMRPAFGIALLIALMVVLGVVVVRWPMVWLLAQPGNVLPPSPSNGSVVVRPNESIMAALEQAEPGSSVIVEPGEYRERIILKDNVRVVSRIPRAATIRLPGAASEAEPAVIASGVSGAELVGFKIIGDAATPLGIGLAVHSATIAIVDVEISGAASTAIDFRDGAEAALVGSSIHDNPGRAITIRSGASPRISHNAFVRNGLSDRAPASLVMEHGARPQFSGNVFSGFGPEALIGLDPASRAGVVRDNWFVNVRPAAPAPSRGRQGQ